MTDVQHLRSLEMQSERFFPLIHGINTASERQAIHVDADTASGVYHLHAGHLAVFDVHAQCSYTAAGEEHTLDLVRGAAVTYGTVGRARHTVKFKTGDGLVAGTLALEYAEGEPILRLRARFELLEAREDVRLETVTLFQTGFEQTFLAAQRRENCRFWRNWHDIWYPTGSRPLEGPVATGEVSTARAYHYAALYSPEMALTFGYQLPNAWFDRVEFTDEGALVAQELIGVHLRPGRPLYSDRLALALGPQFTGALPELMADCRARREVSEARDHFGWNSWEAYHTDVTEADVLENVEAIAALPWLRDRIRYIIVDDGWQKTMGDWTANEKFSSGMDGLAEKIRAAGFEAGIWTGPFLVSPKSSILTEHPEWLLQEGGGPLERNGTRYLDPTHPAVRQHLHAVYSELYSWGFRYYKTDFLVEVPMFFTPDREDYRPDARCYDPELGIVRGMRAAMQAIRSAIGEDSFWVGCGTDIGSGALLMDASRTGGDIGPYWTRVPNQARSVIHHFHLHGKIFLADPDFTLVMGSDTVQEGHLQIALESPEPYVADAWHGGKCFDAEDARTWASLVILSGGLVTLSDRVKYLNETGLSIIRTALHFAGGNAAVPLDIASPIPGVLLREEATRCLLGIINWDDKETISLSVSREMGVEFPASGIVREVWSGEEICLHDGELTVELAPHGCRLLVWER